MWFDGFRAGKAIDLELEARLKHLDGSVEWAVQNQSRMHARNDDRPYLSAVDAMRFWPETATAVAVRYADSGELDVAAPFGLDDLFGAVVRPTPHFLGDKRALVAERIRRKEWLKRWPLLRIERE